MTQSDFCNYGDAYTVVKGTINVIDSNNDAYDKKWAFKNNSPFISSILKINNTLTDNAEHLDIVMPLYNSKNYSKTTGRLYNYSREEPNNGAVRDMHYSINDSESFDYKTSITGGWEINSTEKEVEIAVLSKYLSSFRRTLDIPLINCEINLVLSWSENYVITSKAKNDAAPDANPAVAEINNSAGTTFKIKDQNCIYQ